ncbi:hypothetical protein M1563_04425 [Patescibacteria group bacterium]|nr:hypothetical protein [Patescibacteria group bacterium]
MNNKQIGNIGEQEVVEHVPCPNCGKKLMCLPANFPMYDVQCTGCAFRAQIKTNNTKPSTEILGAGWEIMDKVLKSGFITPPLLANFKWIESGQEKHEIRFYPFIPKSNLKKYKLSDKARRSNYWMFKYIGLDKLPYFLAYKH